LALFSRITTYESGQVGARDYDERMRDLAILLIHLLTTVATLPRPGGARSLIAESVLLRQQLLILNRGRERAPNVKPVCGEWEIVGNASRLATLAPTARPITMCACAISRFC
jgi:hypothetical protein